MPEPKKINHESTKAREDENTKKGVKFRVSKISCFRGENLFFKKCQEFILSSKWINFIKKHSKDIKLSDNPILDELAYDQSSGALLYKGVRYLLIRPETIAGFHKAIASNCGNEADEGLFAGGYAGGSLSAKKYKALHRLSDTEIIEFMMNMGKQIGWGNFNLKRYDPTEKHLCVAVKHSPFAQAYGQSSQSVCHLIRGVLAGMASVLFGTDCLADEVQCRARGDDQCRFVIQAR
jgi:son of sevenless-like protein